MGDVKFVLVVIFYFIYVVGVIFFVLFFGIEKGSLGYIILVGVLFGLVCYVMYDLMNLVIFKDWLIMMIIIDFVWGMVVIIVILVIVYFINLYFFLGVGF